ncbi:hypothetical protein P171DRAFT_430073 [Karstenula rhodostoma CBS 690.94]|uniref:Uncharacterized protein n=1 Tax=Karstenula rhodostoma CBS 690.94 TaxID=1392251 RepID=A0A9P4PN77_9PLEO|nr:hypothetical protein P171DRAFT_430073 [Karstenula rhodostoma CBS 690.94]
MARGNNSGRARKAERSQQHVLPKGLKHPDPPFDTDTAAAALIGLMCLGFALVWWFAR